MGHTSIRQLDGELKSSLIFEFQPIYEGGIFSGAVAALPTEEGAIFLETTTNDPSSIYVRFKGNPFMDFCANLYVYFGFTQSGTSTLPINFEIYHQRVILQASSVSAGPIPFSLIPAGNTEYQNTYELLSQTYPLKVEEVTRNSLTRFELVRVADTNPDDISLLDMNFLIIPKYVDLSHITLYPAGPSCSIVVPGVLSNQGELLSHNGTQDVAIPPPGVSPRVLSYTGTGPTNIEWVDPAVFTGTNKQYSGTEITAVKTMLAAETDFVYKLNNTTAAFDVILEDPAALTNGNFFSFQVMSTNTDTVTIKAPAGVAFFNLTSGDVGPTGSGTGITLSVIGETLEVITDGTAWYVYNLYEESSSGSVVSGAVTIPYSTGAEQPAVGEFVYIDLNGEVSQAVASNSARMPCIGVVTSKGITDATVLTLGNLNGYAGLTLGSTYLVSKTVPGALVRLDLFGGSPGVIQNVAIAILADTFYVNPDITTVVI